MAINAITGDRIATKPMSADEKKRFDANFDRIFGHGVKGDEQCKDCAAMSPNTKEECDQCKADTPAFTELINRLISK